MNKTYAWGLLKKLPKNNQKGFTLIELLVVISILGILAAIVTISLVGITSQARDRAAATELAAVQTAWDTMLADQQVPAGSECLNAVGTPPGTKTMVYVQTGGGLAGNDYFGPSAADPTKEFIPQHKPVALFPKYMRSVATRAAYYCTGNGIINQVRDSYAP